MATKFGFTAVCFAFMVWPVSTTALDRVFEKPQEFVSRHFSHSPPPSSFIYPDAGLRKQIRAILHHDYSKFRIRYWAKDGLTVWLLEEIGKELPITLGFAVNDGRLMTVRVLIFRENRGWEIKYDSFTKQFVGAKLTKSHKLGRNIDGITGATMSVRATVRLARLALLLDQAISGP